MDDWVNVCGPRYGLHLYRPVSLLVDRSAFGGNLGLGFLLYYDLGIAGGSSEKGRLEFRDNKSSSPASLLGRGSSTMSASP